MRLLMVVNVDWFFLSHRLAIAIAAKNAGHEVHIATTLTIGREALEKYGFVVHPLTIDRSSAGLISLVVVLLNLIKIFWKVRPNVAHLVTIKPVLLGGIAARLSPVGAVVFAISGLGHVFVTDGFIGRIRRAFVRAMYAFSLSIKNKRIIFQNTEDLAEVQSILFLESSQVVLIPGSGVDLSLYQAEPLPDSAPVVLMASRLLWTKGVREYVWMAEQIKETNPQVRFLLAGDRDEGNPDSVSQSDINRWSSSQSVELLGYQSDMADLMRQAMIVVLPSYREGFPKVLIEAAACGRAVITTDVPGCRDAVEDGITGLLVPMKSSNALASAVQRLIDNPVLCSSMGQAGRERAERLFDIEQVVRMHLDIYSDLCRALAVEKRL
jgi:glycosyltransferase involved in cell wall biosynthesis